MRAFFQTGNVLRCPDGISGNGRPAFRKKMPFDTLTSKRAVELRGSLKGKTLSESEAAIKIAFALLEEGTGIGDIAFGLGKAGFGPGQAIIAIINLPRLLISSKLHDILTAIDDAGIWNRQELMEGIAEQISILGGQSGEQVKELSLIHDMLAGHPQKSPLSLVK